MKEQLSIDILASFQAFWLWAGGLGTADYALILATVLGMAVVFLFLRADQTARLQASRSLQQNLNEREAQLREEVYVPAAEAIAQAQNLLGDIPATDMACDQVRQIASQVSGALGKAQLVVSETSIRPLMAVTAELSKGQLGLLARRQSLDKVNAELVELGDSVAHLAVERDHLLASLTRCAADVGEEQSIAWHEANARFDKTHRQISSLLGQRKDKLALKLRLEQELNLAAIQSALCLAKLAVPAYLALRDELRLEASESEYRSAAQRSIAEIERHLQSLLEPERQQANRAAAKPVAQTPRTTAASHVGGEPQLKVVLKNQS